MEDKDNLHSGSFNPKSLSFEQEEILLWIQKLYTDGKFDVDASYGNGSFYKNRIIKPSRCFDLDDGLEGCEVSSSDNLPLCDKSINSVVFDPPFLTYIRQNRSGNGKMVMSKRFSGYWSYKDLESHYKKSLSEFRRILTKKGIVVFKCQDIIHNHKIHPTHINIVKWADDVGFTLKDLFILGAKHRMPRPNLGSGPKHARIYHSYFLVLEKQ